ncbi:MAG TPA: biotin/lipoyl-containing protein [Clostridia bacterium]|nr:biotin/lipoyl-containing protein [Clostridia bacterium]
MRKFVINVNGKSYEVEVEEVGQGTTKPMPVSAAPVSNPIATPAPAPKRTETPKPASGGAVPQGANTIKAPMPGTILDIKVQTGDRVSKGQVLAILEAMKMENEIMSPGDGEIVSVQVAKGASVNAGDVLIAIQ